MSQIEKFRINGRLCSVEPNPDEPGFIARYAGSRICKAPTKEEARKLLHGYLINQSRAEIGSYQKMVNDAQYAIDQLGDDPFNLGRFRV